MDKIKLAKKTSKQGHLDPDDSVGNSSHTKPKRSDKDKTETQQVKVKTKMDMNQFSEISSNASFLDSEEGVGPWENAPNRYGGGTNKSTGRNPFKRDRPQSSHRSRSKPFVESDGNQIRQSQKDPSVKSVSRQASELDEGDSAKPISSKRTTVKRQDSSNKLPPINSRQKYLESRHEAERNRQRIVNQGEEYEGDDEEDALIFHSVRFHFCLIQF